MTKEPITKQAIVTAISDGLSNYQQERSLGCGRVYVCIGAYGDIFEKDEEVKAANEARTQEHRALVKAAAKALNKSCQCREYKVENALYIGYDSNSGIELGQGEAIASNLKALCINTVLMLVGG